MTGQTKRLKRINNRKDQLPFVKEISQYSLHTSSVEKYTDNLKEILKIVPKMFEEYKAEFYRKLKFSGYIDKQKTYDKLCKRVNGDEKGREVEGKTLVGWGNGGTNRKGLKGSKMPCKGFKKEVERQCSRVYLEEVDEYLTTKMCSKCGCETQGVKVWKEIMDSKGDKSVKKVEIYGLRRCKNNGCRITWNRDVNASRNILKILLCSLRGEERPSYLLRKQGVSETGPGGSLADTNTWEDKNLLGLPHGNMFHVKLSQET